MQKTAKDNFKVNKDLGDGLLLRSAISSDRDALANFHATVQSDEGPDQPDENVRTWVLDLFENPHPTFKVSDFTLVEDIKKGKIVSSMNLISQTWSYGGITFGVGRPELVGTLPEYRQRGLVRAQFEIIHRWSAERGEKLQAIAGIPNFYRQFGYEMGLNLGGGRVGYLPLAPKLENGKDEPFIVRIAEKEDLEFIDHLYKQACTRYLMSCFRDREIWRYELVGKSAENINRSVICLIESRSGDPVGFLAHPVLNWGHTLMVQAFELTSGVSWNAVTPTVIRYLCKTGNALAAQKGKDREFGAFGFWLGTDHPVYSLLRDTLPRVRKPYAWYVRIRDLPGFLNHIAPVLEQRLAASSFACHSGEVKITLYRSGLSIVFECGRIVKIEKWDPVPKLDSGDAAFPDLTFLQLLFGYRSLEELDYAFADCWWEKDPTFGLLNALFPKQASHIWPLA